MFERHDRPEIAKHGREHPLGEGSELIDRQLHLGSQLVELLGRVRCRIAGPLSRELKLDPQRDQPLLGSVMQVPLDLLPGIVGARDRARMRVAHLPDQVCDVDREPLILQTQTRVGPDHVDERRLGFERLVMNEHGHHVPRRVM